ncbi:MAG: helix-turn-helix domain-containing protein [Ferrovum myxofaciens]|uniref:helix-turn-helix domain-containing protein n=1 Tax=Ferrovum myxofaciens TaxID=416213 RepID=UPI002355319C|nr:helix-turn-helix domain-containing protein [Ferrovum myxofaciens]QKE40706.1 MAG: helix-turn-helix domain-containing protein [Ferrovum myxofaciens]
METAFDKIRIGLEQAIGHASGKDVSGVVLHRIAVPDVKAIRQMTGLTQMEFAARCRISLYTLRHWERGDRKPHGPAVALLNLVAQDPVFVMSSLVNAR